MSTSEKNSNQVKTISAVMILTLLGKILGLLRDRLLTVSYGSGMATNAFLTASRIPRVFFDAVFASAISASFIPIFNEYFAKDGKKRAFDFSGNFSTVIGILTLIITALGTVFAEPLVHLFADGYDTETAALCVSLTRIMFPTVFFTGIAYSFVGILQSCDRFNVPALISVISNGIIIVYYYTFNKRFGIYGLAVAFLIAWIMQAVVQVPSLHKTGFRFRPDFNFRTEGMKKVFRLMLPVMVSTWVQPINLTINSRFGSHLFDGAGVAAIELSTNLYLIIVGVFVLSVTNVIFPKLSRLTAGNERASVNGTVSATMHTSLYFVIPMMIGLMALSTPIINLIYGGGEFDEFSVNITSRALFFVSIGMVGYTVQTVLCRVYFAEQNGRVPLIAGGASIIVNTVLCVLLTDTLDVAGLAVASTVSVTVNAVILIIPLQRRGDKFINPALIFDTLKELAAALVMGIAAYFLSSVFASLLPGAMGKIASVAVPAAAGVAVYFVITRLLGLSEAKMVTGTLKRLISNKS